MVLTLAMNSSSVAGLLFFASAVDDVDFFPIRLSKAEAAFAFPDFDGLSRSEDINKYGVLKNMVFLTKY